MGQNKLNAGKREAIDLPGLKMLSNFFICFQIGYGLWNKLANPDKPVIKKAEFDYSSLNKVI
jgi:hypothetical protein